VLFSEVLVVILVLLDLFYSSDLMWKEIISACGSYLSYLLLDPRLWFSSCFPCGGQLL
jgi:hypothetical protein